VPLHSLHVAPDNPTVVAPNARTSPVSSALKECRRLGRAELARFCMSRALFASFDQASLFDRRGKRFVAGLSVASPPDKKIRLATQQEPEKVKVMARLSSDRSGLFSAEEPTGPFRTCQVPTEAVAVPLHSLHVAPDNPTVVAPNAREQAHILNRCLPDSQRQSLPPALFQPGSSRSSRPTRAAASSAVKELQGRR